jgi:hypothetical protein
MIRILALSWRSILQSLPNFLAPESFRARYHVIKGWRSVDIAGSGRVLSAPKRRPEPEI